jgi:hypothetical protein
MCSLYERNRNPDDNRKRNPDDKCVPYTRERGTLMKIVFLVPEKEEP